MLDHRLASRCISLFALACSAPNGHSETAGLGELASSLHAEEYLDARDYFTEPEDIDRWYALTFSLKEDFDAVCGDTFCEGDYSNYESLGFRCSVERRAAVIAQCVWIFAASTAEIDSATGDVNVHGETWSCRMPIAPHTSAADFLSALAVPGERPSYARLPGSDQSLYDGLVDCL